MTGDQFVRHLHARILQARLDRHAIASAPPEVIERRTSDGLKYRNIAPERREGRRA